MKKMKPIPCFISTENGNINAFANLYSGEITISKSFFWTNDILKITINLNNNIYNYAAKGIGGKYFVINHKEQPIFKDVYLNEKLKKTIPKNESTPIKKAKI